MHFVAVKVLSAFVMFENIGKKRLLCILSYDELWTLEKAFFPSTSQTLKKSRICAYSEDVHGQIKYRLEFWFNKELL